MTDGLPLASDGLIARPMPAWTEEKLYYIGRYIDIFCTAMKEKWPSLVYADLLAGPGLVVDPESGEEQAGSALLAVKRPEFRKLFLNDVDPSATAALRARIGAESAKRVRVETMDCNKAVDAARDFLFPKGPATKALGLAVIDPTAFQMTYEAIARLTDGLRIDLIIVFMSGFVHRFISEPSFASSLDGFFGTKDWRTFVDRRSGGERLSYGEMLDLYKEQLGKLGYRYLNEPDRNRMTNSRKSTIYHVLFASKHPLGADFSRKVSQITISGQRRLPGDF